MKTLTISPSRKEATWAIRYFLFSTLILPSILVYADTLFSLNISAPWLNLLYYGINFLSVLWIFRIFLKESLSLLKSRVPGVIVTAVLMLVVYFTASQIIGYLLFLYRPDFFNVNDSVISQNAERNYLITAIGTIFFVPVTEELLHRGFIFGVLQRKSRVLAYLVSTLVFASIHITGYIGSYPAGTLLLCLVQYLPAGLCLGYAYEKADSIFCPILMHMTINAIGIAAMR